MPLTTMAQPSVAHGRLSAMTTIWTPRRRPTSRRSLEEEGKGGSRSISRLQSTKYKTGTLVLVRFTPSQKAGLVVHGVVLAVPLALLLLSQSVVVQSYRRKARDRSWRLFLPPRPSPAAEHGDRKDLVSQYPAFSMLKHADVMACWPHKSPRQRDRPWLQISTCWAGCLISATASFHPTRTGRLVRGENDLCSSAEAAPFTESNPGVGARPRSLAVLRRHQGRGMGRTSLPLHSYPIFKVPAAHVPE